MYTYSIQIANFEKKMIKRDETIQLYSAQSSRPKYNFNSYHEFVIKVIRNDKTNIVEAKENDIFCKYLENFSPSVTLLWRHIFYYTKFGKMEFLRNLNETQ